MEPNGRICLNCSSPLAPNDIFCPQCGQKDKDTRVSFFRIAREAFATLFNLDSQLFRTLLFLFIPGRLSIEFFRGKQKKYLHPVRLFLWVAFLLVALITWVIPEVKNDINEDMKRSWELRKAMVYLDSAMLQTIPLFPKTDIQGPFDSLKSQYIAVIPNKTDSINLNELKLGLEEGVQLVSIDDIYELSQDSLLKKYQIEGFWPRIIAKQKIKFLVHGASLPVYLIGKLTWAILFLMPLLAMGLKLLYIRRNFFFVEHLVFSLHTHTLAFFVITLVLLGEILFHNILNSAFGMLLLLIGLYVLLALKQFYRQSWRKTILKFVILQFFYVFLLTIATIFTVLVSFFLF
jgi:hypothetical protein